MKKNAIVIESYWLPVLLWRAALLNTFDVCYEVNGAPCPKQGSWISEYFSLN